MRKSAAFITIEPGMGGTGYSSSGMVRKETVRIRDLISYDECAWRIWVFDFQTTNLILEKDLVRRLE